MPQEEIFDFPEVWDGDGVHLLYVTSADGRRLSLNFDTPIHRDDFCVRWPWRMLKAMSSEAIRKALYAFHESG